MSKMQLEYSHHDERAAHAPRDILAMATLIVVLLAIALLIGAALSALKISSPGLPVSMQGMASIFMNDKCA
jgi:hypothetical protein